MYGNTSDGSFEFLGKLFKLAILILIASILYPLICDFVKYGKLPFTTHAKESHSSQNWNATTIEKYFDSGNCSPDTCTVKDTVLHYCQYKDSKYSLLLVIGRVTEQIITGYMVETNRIGKLCSR